MSEIELPTSKFLKCWNLVVQLAREDDQQQLTTAFNNIRNRVSIKSIFLYQDHDRLSILHHAALHNNAPSVHMLLRLGAVPELRGPGGNTALHLACKNGHHCEAAVRALIQSRRVSVNVKNDDSETPLMLAVKSGYSDLVRTLLERMDVQIDLQNTAKRTALHMASQLGDGNICRILLAAGASITAVDHHGFSSLMMAAGEGFTDAATALLECLTSPQMRTQNLCYRDLLGQTALHHAAYRCKPDTTSLLLRNGADPNIYSKARRTPLHVSAIRGCASVTELLLRNSCQVDVVDEHGLTALHCAAANGHLQVLQQLLSAGANVNLMTNTNMTPLVCALKNGQEIVGKYLLQHSRTTGQISGQLREVIVSTGDSDMRTALHWSVLLGQSECFDLILKRGPKIHPDNWMAFINKRDKTMSSALHYAASTGNLSFVSKLLENGADMMAHDLSHCTPVELAARGGHLDVTKILSDNLCKCLNVNTSTSNRGNAYTISLVRDTLTNALLGAASAGAIDVFHMLTNIEIDSVPVDWCDMEGVTPLMKACNSNSTDTVKELLNLEVDVNERDNDNNTALHYAANSGSDACVRILLRQGARITENCEGNTPVDLACYADRDAMAIFFESEFLENTMAYRRENGRSFLDLLIKRDPDLAKSVMDACIVDLGSQMHNRVLYQYDCRLVDPGPPISKKHRRYYALNTMIKYFRQDLMRHQLTTSILNRKWSKIGRPFFLVDLVTYIAFLALITAYIMIEKPPTAAQTYDPVTRCPIATQNATSASRKTAGTGLKGVKSGIVSLIALRLLMEALLLLSWRWKYVCDLTRYISLTMYGMVAFFCHPIDQTPCVNEWIMGAAGVLLAWLLLLLPFRLMGFFGTYALMYIEVLWTLVKVLAIFVFLIFGFAQSFYITMRKQADFNSLDRALTSVLGMSIGELDYSDRFVATTNKPFTEMTYVVFVIFVLMMCVALMNLLVGLAVGDIESMQLRAQFEQQSLRADLAWGIERILPRPLQLYIHEPFLELPKPKLGRLTRIKHRVIGISEYSVNKQAQMMEERQQRKLADSRGETELDVMKTDTNANVNVDDQRLRQLEVSLEDIRSQLQIVRSRANGRLPRQNADTTGF